MLLVKGSMVVYVKCQDCESRDVKTSEVCTMNNVASVLEDVNELKLELILFIINPLTVCWIIRYLRYLPSELAYSKRPDRQRRMM